jgi:hypothetical protein
VQHLVAVDRSELDNGIHTVVVDVVDTYEMEELLEGNTVLSSQRDEAGVVVWAIALDLRIIALVDQQQQQAMALPPANENPSHDTLLRDPRPPLNQS